MEIKISQRKIGSGYPVFLVAELSANHNGNFSLALKTIKAMKEAGADAVKLQTYTADTMTISSRKEYFRIKQGTIWDGGYIYDLYKKASTPWEWQPKLKKYAESIGLIFFSTPFDRSAVDFLEKINVPAYKIASAEITDIPLIEYVASKGKPVILSSGIAIFDDLTLAIKTCHDLHNQDIAILKCTSLYPTPIDELNLSIIPKMQKKYKKIIGFSDHTLANHASIIAVTLGAKIIEKHFILDKKLGGPDASFSSNPDEFKELVKIIRLTEKSLGKTDDSLSKRITKVREHSRSLFIIKNIKKGERLTYENIRSIRPGYGMHPKHLTNLIGRRVKKDLEKGTPLEKNLII